LRVQRYALSAKPPNFFGIIFKKSLFFCSFSHFSSVFELLFKRFFS